MGGGHIEEGIWKGEEGRGTRTGWERNPLLRECRTSQADDGRRTNVVSGADACSARVQWLGVRGHCTDWCGFVAAYWTYVPIYRPAPDQGKAVEV